MDQVGVYDDSDRPDALTTTHLFGIFPAIFAPNWGRGAELRQLWSGIIGMTGDLVPFVGRLGEGMTKRSVAGRTRGSRVAGPSSSSSDGRADALQEPGEWIAAGYSGEGMVWAWLCGTALGIMMAGTDGGSSSANEDGEEEAASEEDIPGQPRGLLKDWFPGELRVTRARLRTAHVSNLAEQF
jgi:glycine/D-amino acid oxidase-like deaminating enzyme